MADGPARFGSISRILIIMVYGGVLFSMYYRTSRIFWGMVHNLAHQDVITYVAAGLKVQSYIPGPAMDHKPSAKDLKFHYFEIESI